MVEQDADGTWIDPEATGDDAVWREVCGSHDTFTAEHEPVTVDDRECPSCGADLLGNDPHARGCPRDDDGIRIVWLPVNQAWLVMWHDSRLAGPLNDRAEAEEYVRDIRASVATHPAGKGRST